jgi:hypothetical protein
MYRCIPMDASNQVFRDPHASTNSIVASCLMISMLGALAIPGTVPVLISLSPLLGNEVSRLIPAAKELAWRR